MGLLYDQWNVSGSTVSNFLRKTHKEWGVLFYTLFSWLTCGHSR